MASIIESILDCFRPLTNCIEQDPANCRAPRAVPTLPQNDSPARLQRRRRELRTLREKYVYNYGYIPGLAMVDKVPLREYPGLDWFLLALGQASKVADNLMALLNTPAALESLGDVSVDDAPLRAFHGRLSELKERHEELLDKHAGHPAVVEVRRVRQDSTISTESLTDTSAATDTAVFAGDGSNLMWRDAWESSSGCSCGAVTHECLDMCGEIVRIDSELLAPCAYCTKQAVTVILDEICVLLGDFLAHVLSEHGLFGRAADIEDFNHQFSTLPLPDLGREDGPGYFEKDDVFALRQLAGQNPMKLTLVRDLDKLRRKMPVTDQQYQVAMGKSDTPDRAVAEQRLFFVDYDFSTNVTKGSDEPRFAGQKYIGSPIGLFALNDDKALVAVAIQCQQEPGDENPVITPGDGHNWSIAKTVFNNAAGNDSEFVQHLGYAHLLTQAFALAAARTLPSQHPLAVLLAPHMEGTMFANDMAQSGMNQPPELNAIGAEISATIPDTLFWTSRAVAAVDVSEWMLPAHFERQGTADAAVLPHYPYRDDAMRIWDAINTWVDGYVRIYYKSDADVVADFELQDFARECQAHDGSRLRNVGDDGKFTSIESLITTITLIVYQASAHHALTNFPLQKIELYAPALPLAIYQPPPTASSGATFEDYMAYLPPLEISVIQQSLYFLIGTLHYTKLGHYPAGWFADPDVAPCLTTFQRRLREIEAEIAAENQTRPMPYVYLIPHRIPQSTNI